MTRTWRTWALVGLVALVGAGRFATPLGAAVTGISPGTVTIDPGAGATATVRISSERVSCLTLRPSSADIFAEVSNRCDAGDWTSTLSVSASLDTPPGTYNVRVIDEEGGESAGRTLTIRVRGAAPPPTSPPTTTPPPAAPTTVPPPAPVVPETTTTTSTTTSTTIAPPTTTTAPPATTTTTQPEGPSANADPAGAFASISSLVALGLPPEGVFVPLTDPAFEKCLPLGAACEAPSSPLIIVPARTTSMRWVDPSGSGSTLGLQPLELAAPPSATAFAAVGDAPAERAGTANYSLPVVALTSGGANARAELRTLDAGGALAPTDAATDGRAALLPVAVGPLVPNGASSAAPTFAAGAPFGRPTSVQAARLTQAAPAIVILRGTGGQVLHGIRPDPTWDAGVDLLPLFAGNALPYLVRGVDGSPGLYVARPTSLRVDAAPAAGADPSKSPSEGGTSPVAVLAGTAVIAALLTGAAVAVRRRTRTPQ